MTDNITKADKTTRRKWHSWAKKIFPQLILCQRCGILNSRVMRHCLNHKYSELNNCIPICPKCNGEINSLLIFKGISSLMLDEYGHITGYWAQKAIAESIKEYLGFYKPPYKDMVEVLLEPYKKSRPIGETCRLEYEDEDDYELPF